MRHNIKNIRSGAPKRARKYVQRGYYTLHAQSIGTWRSGRDMLLFGGGLVGLDWSGVDGGGMGQMFGMINKTKSENNEIKSK